MIWLHLIEYSVKVSSSPNSPILFAIVCWGETNISSLSQVFFKIDVLKNFSNFTGKHQCFGLFTKVAGLKATPTHVFSCEICEIFKNTFFKTTPPVAASEQTQEVSVVHSMANGFLII